MTFVRRDTVSPVPMVPGVTRRTLATGERIMFCQIHLDAGAVVPTHQHPHEQVGYVLSGRIRLMVEGEEDQIFEPGDTYAIGGGTAHGAEAVEETLLVEAFSPPRDEYRQG